MYLFAVPSELRRQDTNTDYVRAGWLFISAVAVSLAICLTHSLAARFCMAWMDGWRCARFAKRGSRPRERVTDFTFINSEGLILYLTELVVNYMNW